MLRTFWPYKAIYVPANPIRLAPAVRNDRASLGHIVLWPFVPRFMDHKACDAWQCDARPTITFSTTGDVYEGHTHSAVTKTRIRNQSDALPLDY